MKWAKPLIRLSTHEVETVQKRVAEISARRWAIEAQIESLDREVAEESANAHANAEAGLYMIGFREGAKKRRLALEASLAMVAEEERGARDALAEAFETLKKYEHVAENARIAAVKKADRIETAALDEMGRRTRS